MISARDTMIAVLKSVRNQQTAIIDDITSIGALLDYLDSRDSEFRAHLEKYQHSNRGVSDLVTEFAHMIQVFDEVIQRLESGEEMRL